MESTTILYHQHTTRSQSRQSNTDIKTPLTRLNRSILFESSIQSLHTLPNTLLKMQLTPMLASLILTAFALAAPATEVVQKRSGNLRKSKHSIP